ncbi:hypothetical protein ACWEFL_12405 [Streptomyces sp. NPDC004838]
MVNQEVPRRICAATATLPLPALVLVLDIAPDEPVHPMHVITGLRCRLEFHASGSHFDLVRELEDASGGEVWARWDDGSEPDYVAILPDCPAIDAESGPAADACTLFAGHFGGHCFEFSDPEYDSVRTSPAYDQLKAEIDDRLRSP